jgi:predicted DCC family thiol-disulfide oxidoreductase YuxK
MKSAEHLLFFDHECPFCVRSVRQIIQNDSEHRFEFAPLRGHTAKEVLSGPQTFLKKTNSLVVVENWRSTDRKFWIKSRAVLRVYWLIGGQWKLFGWLSFLPRFLGDFIYDQVSAHRHQFHLRADQEIGPEDRFLP